MKGKQGLFIFRRLTLFMLGLVVIVFGTSPKIIVENLNNVTFQDSSFMSHYIQPLIVILINQLLLMMIDWASHLECYETHSLYQRAVFMKSVVYLGLNMMVVPALSL
jgi:hypothetical protein